MLFDNRCQFLEVTIDNGAIEGLGAFGIETGGGGETDGRVSFNKRKRPVFARSFSVWVKSLRVRADGFLVQWDTCCAQVLDPLDKDSLLCRSEKLLRRSGLRAGFVEVIEAGMESRYRNTVIQSNTFDIRSVAKFLASDALDASLCELLVLG